MSMRSIIEVNHDYLHDLKQNGHISHELFNWLCSAYERDHPRFQGLRYLQMRHHSETVELKVE